MCHATLSLTDSMWQALATGQPSAVATAQRAASALSQVCMLTPRINCLTLAALGCL